MIHDEPFMCSKLEDIHELGGMFVAVIIVCNFLRWNAS